MNIALIGYGKMGKEIEKIAFSRKHEIALIVEKDNADLVSDNDLKRCDVAIEFSTPKTAVENIEKCMSVGLPVVVGTTGWYQNFERVKKLCDKNKGSLFYATNFSLGVNIFMKINSQLATLMNNYKDYEVSIEEIHHIHKNEP